jgi:lysine/ornithine N-monooxygenase
MDCGISVRRYLTSINGKLPESSPIRKASGSSSKMASGSRRVVVAASIGRFAGRPPEFEGLPSALGFHTSEHCELRQFARKRALVVGGGQSA